MRVWIVGCTNKRDRCSSLINAVLDNTVTFVLWAMIHIQIFMTIKTEIQRKTFQARSPGSMNAGSLTTIFLMHSTFRKCQPQPRSKAVLSRQPVLCCWGVTFWRHAEMKRDVSTSGSSKRR
ncbi:unnamed protein product [Schistocephalus solidus]|uniref:Secreted protein n=1 Tax=Schistocephalus solidus TaxID=70667 RepID=A0A183TH19_SCHSO|nr:unnamed protein product [Schistocephalus solidus]